MNQFDASIKNVLTANERLERLRAFSEWVCLVSMCVCSLYIVMGLRFTQKRG